MLTYVSNVFTAGKFHNRSFFNHLDRQHKLQKIYLVYLNLRPFFSDFSGSFFGSILSSKYLKYLLVRYNHLKKNAMISS